MRRSNRLVPRTEPARKGGPLSIAVLAPPWIPVPPPAYGGIESVIALLSAELVRRGHDVQLFCAPGSHSTAQVHPLLEEPQPEVIGSAQFEADHVARAFSVIDERGKSRNPFDVVHDHCGFTALAMADRITTPLVHTIHGPFTREMAAFYRRHGAKGRLVCISRSQARAAPAAVKIDAVVPNPVEIPIEPVSSRRGEYLLWMGRITPEKGPHRAIEVARAAGRPLILAGPVQRANERFFAEQIKPHVDGRSVRYVGEVGGVVKQRLFAQAHAFLMPIRWAEPFGMVMIEALAAGTPVIAFRQASAPEIVDHGTTGFLVEDEQEMAAAVSRVTTLDPARCRAAASRWSPAAIAARYESVYRRTIDSAATGYVGDLAITGL